MTLKIDEDQNEQKMITELKEGCIGKKLTMRNSEKDENTIYLEKTNINKKLYFYSVEENMKVCEYIFIKFTRRQFLQEKGR